MSLTITFYAYISIHQFLLGILLLVIPPTPLEFILPYQFTLLPYGNRRILNSMTLLEQFFPIHLTDSLCPF